MYFCMFGWIHAAIYIYIYVCVCNYVCMYFYHQYLNVPLQEYKLPSFQPRKKSNSFKLTNSFYFFSSRLGPAPTTPCAVRVVPELDSSFVRPTLSDENSPLLLEVTSGDYVSDIEVTNVTEDKHPALLKPSEEEVLTICRYSTKIMK